MGYESGMLYHRVTIYNKVAPEKQKFGETTTYEPTLTVHANVTWKKGQKSLNEGAMDCIDTILVRMRWNNYVTRDSQLEYDGRRYQIMSLHADRQENTVQITAQEITNNN